MLFENKILTRSQVEERLTELEKAGFTHLTYGFDAMTSTDMMNGHTTYESAREYADKVNNSAEERILTAGEITDFKKSLKPDMNFIINESKKYGFEWTELLAKASPQNLTELNDLFIGLSYTFLPDERMQLIQAIDSKGHSIAGEQFIAENLEKENLDLLKNQFGVDLTKYESIAHYSNLNNQTTMNTENLEFLKNQVKYLGFDEALTKPMEDAISKGVDKFTLESTAPWKTQKGNDVVFDLSFSKGNNENERYFLNSYKAEVKDNATKELVVSQDFQVNYTKGITAKEAFNLLEGRAVYKSMESKDHEKFNAWVQLNPNNQDEKGNMKFAMFNDNYGFDLSNAMKNIIGDNYQFKQSAADATASLKKGNLVELVPMAHVENKASFYASANPQYKTLNVFDAEGNKQFVDNTRKEGPSKSVGADVPVAVEEKKAAGVKR